ncbi:MAG TPA: SpoIIE family protein phosphatase [Blastococcus sp.]|nr:SpoIIE family protein phosphatase [Blastococcus sp.]
MLLEHAPVGIVLLDVDTGCFVSVNAAAANLFGVDRERLLRVGPVELSPREQPDGRPSQATAREYLDQALAGGRPRFEWTHRRGDGAELPCEVTLLRLPSADRRLVCATIVDVTGQQQARSAAEAGAARLRTMVAGLNAVVWERDPYTLRIRYINDRAEELLGYPAAQWLEHSELWPGILHPDDREPALRRVRQAVATDVDFTMSYRARTRDGRWLWLQHLGHVARDDAGHPRALHVVLIDVTESKRREQAAALLASASRVLATGGSLEERLGEVAALAVGPLGDRALVWLRGDDDRYRLVAAAPDEVAARGTDVPPLTIPDELKPRVGTDRPFAVGEVSEAMRRDAAGGDGRFALLAADDGVRSRLVAPLVTAGQRVGLLTVSTADPHRHYDDDDLAVTGELGQRIAAMVAAEQAAVRQRQLQQLTAALSAAGTVAEATAALTAGLREALDASVVSVSTVDPDELLHTVEARGYPHERLGVFATMPLTAPFPPSEAARTRRPVYLPDRAAAVERFPQAEPHLLPTTQGVAALPLLAQDRVVGVLSVTFATPRRFDDDERAFLRTVADQVAIALERAALADVRREVADTLQRSLLPTRLPQLDRLEVVTRYLAAGEGMAAGGDWYDVHRLRDGRVALAVGDIVGNGAAAAAAMGQLRSSLATLLLAGHPPAEALELLDLFADEVPGAGVCTVACLQLDPATGTLIYSRAGHPPPVVVDSGGTAFLDEGLGPALGLPGRGPRPQATATVPPGGTLLLFTDGLVESRAAALDTGLGRLAAAVTARRDAPLAAVVDGVLADLVDATGAADDIAVVAVRLLPPPLHLDLPADPAQLSRVRRQALDWASGAGLDPDTAQDLELALGEAVANSVEHAYRDTDVPGRVQVTLDRDAAGGLTVTVTDGGTWHPPAADSGYRGRGLQMINTLAADVELHHGPSGTVLRFRLLPVPSVPGSATVSGAPVPTVAAPAEERPAALATSEDGGRQLLALTGDLDLVGATAVRDSLLAALADGDRPVTLDLTGLGFVASVGVGLLLHAARAARDHRDLDVLLPTAGRARRALDITGLTTALLAPPTDPSTTISSWP